MHPIFITDSEGNIKMKPIGHVKLPVDEYYKAALF